MLGLRGKVPWEERLATLRPSRVPGIVRRPAKRRQGNLWVRLLKDENGSFFGVPRRPLYSNGPFNCSTSTLLQRLS